MWRLLRPLYGLRTSPRYWQDFFAGVLAELGGQRLKSDANVYCFLELECYLLVYVDDIVILGNYPDELFLNIQERVLLRPTGELKAGETVDVLGRRLKHNGDDISFVSGKDYIDNRLEEHGLTDAKPTSVPEIKD